MSEELSEEERCEEMRDDIFCSPAPPHDKLEARCMKERGHTDSHVFVSPVRLSGAVAGQVIVPQ